MGLHCDLLPEVVCDPWAIVFLLLAPYRIRAEMICQLVILSFDILDGEVVVVSGHHNIGDFIRDLIEGLVIINGLESFVVGVDVEMGTTAKPLSALLQCDDDGQVLPIDGRETFRFL